MDIMKKMDQGTLNDEMMEEESQHTNDEAEDLSNSLREIVQDEAVKPKLHCLMMDSSFSMVTVQSEDSGIVWETASSRCSTPWSSEMNSAALEPCYSMVPKCTGTPRSETAGKIIFIMDEDHIIRRKKKKPNKGKEKVTQQPVLMDIEVTDPDRPAMVEISLPNMGTEDEREVAKEEDPKEEGNQRLFRLVSEGSEILNIIVPPKVSTVDEEESKGLVDNLSYLEDTPVTKADQSLEEPETSEEIQTGNLQHLQSVAPVVPEPQLLLPPIKPPRRGATSEDYFEKFTLLDHQTPTIAPTEQASNEPIIDQVIEIKDGTVDAQAALRVPADFTLGEGLEITSEHVDEVFYGGGRDPDHQSLTRNGANKEGELTKSPLKESGSALFGSQESILTPIFLPEGPPKIIDPVLLEEPKAMAFMYSDLYAEAIGSRIKQEDMESITSEKSFHSQESDSEDRGYLEKFVLKDETPVTEVEPRHDDDHKEVGERIWSQDAFGLTQKEKAVTGALENEDEITDFFRNSASSSPCEPIHLHDVEPEETEKVPRTRRVAFQDETAKEDKTVKEVGSNLLQTSDDDIEIAEAFLPLDISMDYTAVPTSWEAVDEKSTVSAHTTKSEKPKVARGKPNQQTVLTVLPPRTVKPITPRHKPFLDLTPLLPVEIPEEAERHEEIEEKKEVAGANSVCWSSGEETGGDTLDYELISKQEAGEYAQPQSCSVTEGESSDNGSFTVVDHPNQDHLYDAVEAGYEIVDGPDS